MLSHLQVRDGVWERAAVLTPHPHAHVAWRQVEDLHVTVLRRRWVHHRFLTEEAESRAVKSAERRRERAHTQAGCFSAVKFCSTFPKLMKT